MIEEVESESALRANISSKGNNSYYYAHGKTANGPQWDGKEEPRLLSRESIDTSNSSTKLMLASFDSFSWLDETKFVKVYIDYEGAIDINDDNISLKTTDNSVEFIVLDSKSQCLNLSPLNANIESATYQKKSDKFVLKLKKAKVESWDKLKKTS